MISQKNFGFICSCASKKKKEKGKKGHLLVDSGSDADQHISVDRTEYLGEEKKTAIFFPSVLQWSWQDEKTCRHPRCWKEGEGWFIYPYHFFHIAVDQCLCTIELENVYSSFNEDFMHYSPATITLVNGLFWLTSWKHSVFSFSVTWRTVALLLFLIDTLH